MFTKVLAVELTADSPYNGLRLIIKAEPIAVSLEDNMQPEETKRPLEPEEQSPTLEPIEEDETTESRVSSFPWDDAQAEEDFTDEEDRDPYDLTFEDETDEPVHAATFAAANVADADDEAYDGSYEEDLAEPQETVTTERPTWGRVTEPFTAAGIASSANRPQPTPSFERDRESMDRPTAFSPEAGATVRPAIAPLSERTQVGERLPLHQPKLAEIDPMLYEYWREHINQGFQRNNRMFDTILDAFMRPYNTTIWMYRILFGLGIAAFLVAAGLGAWLREPMFSLIFGGLSIISFLTYFIGRPLQSLEENLKFITWLGIIYNTYWTRLVYMMDSETIHKDLDDATQDAINELERLLDKHHDFSGKRPGLR
jgi:hypothetical protein